METTTHTCQHGLLRTLPFKVGRFTFAELSTNHAPASSAPIVKNELFIAEPPSQARGIGKAFCQQRANSALVASGNGPALLQKSLQATFLHLRHQSHSCNRSRSGNRHSCPMHRLSSLLGFQSSCLCITYIRLLREFSSGVRDNSHSSSFRGLGQHGPRLNRIEGNAALIDVNGQIRVKARPGSGTNYEVFVVATVESNWAVIHNPT